MRARSYSSSLFPAGLGVAWNAVVPSRCMPGARKPEIAISDALPRLYVAPGSEVSLCQLREHVFIQHKIRHHPFETYIFFFQFFQSSGFLSLHGTVLITPTVKCRFCDAHNLADLRDALTGIQPRIRFIQLFDDLLG